MIIDEILSRIESRHLQSISHIENTSFSTCKARKFNGESQAKEQSVQDSASLSFSLILPLQDHITVYRATRIQPQLHGL